MKSKALRKSMKAIYIFVVERDAGKREREIKCVCVREREREREREGKERQKERKRGTIVVNKYEINTHAFFHTHHMKGLF